MNDILQSILDRKHIEVRERSLVTPLQKLETIIEATAPPRGFFQAIQRRVEAGQAAVIAEVKKASPSKGVIREVYEPEAIAQSYERGGATGLSVLTDRDFFQGSERYLQMARSACSLPVLRKDFIVDAYQVYESRALGADCVLLIVAALSDRQLAEFCHIAMSLQMDVLVEVHDLDELERALQLPAQMIGVNNRNLRNFQVSLQTSLDLHAVIPPDRLTVAESGIESRADVAALRGAGIQACLIGEAFIRAADPGQALSELFSAEV